MFLPSNQKIYLAVGITDMRKAINGLSILVEQDLLLNPFSGNLFAFCNRLNTIIKILYWDHNGLCLWTKRLEKQKFKWPRCDEDIQAISHRELQWLLAGLDLDQPTAFSRLCYTTLI